MEKYDSQDDRYMSGAANWYCGVEFRRGFPHRVTVPQLSDALRYAIPASLGGALKPTPWLSAVLRHHPVQEVVPADRKPDTWAGVVQWLRSDVPDGLDTPAKLPDPVFDSLDGGDRTHYALHRYATPDLAITALARAIVRVGRG